MALVLGVASSAEYFMWSGFAIRCEAHPSPNDEVGTTLRIANPLHIPIRFATELLA